MTSLMSAKAPALALAALDLVWIAVLARLFFRPGRLNAQWWLNSAPFALAGVMLVADFTGAVTTPITGAPVWSVAVASLGALLCAASFGLMGWTVGAHRSRPALWRQSDDTPDNLVTEGPYAWIRHPFYASYIVTLVACAILVPHWASLAALALGWHRLNSTAALEEERFLTSPFGERYRAYMLRTGRFLPRRRRPTPDAHERVRERRASRSPMPPLAGPLLGPCRGTVCPRLAASLRARGTPAPAG